MTAEQRVIYDAEIARSREALDYWRRFAPESYSPTTAARVAAADQLEGCEALLRAVGASFAGEDGNVALSQETYGPWVEQIKALGLAPCP